MGNLMRNLKIFIQEGNNTITVGDSLATFNSFYKKSEIICISTKKENCKNKSNRK